MIYLDFWLLLLLLDYTTSPLSVQPCPPYQPPPNPILLHHARTITTLLLIIHENLHGKRSILNIHLCPPHLDNHKITHQRKIQTSTYSTHPRLPLSHPRLHLPPIRHQNQVNTRRPTCHRHRHIQTPDKSLGPPTTH